MPKAYTKWPARHAAGPFSPVWDPSRSPQPLRTPRKLVRPKTRFFCEISILAAFGPLSAHIGHFFVMVDQFYIGWPILRPKNRSQADFGRIWQFLGISEQFKPKISIWIVICASNNIKGTSVMKKSRKKISAIFEIFLSPRKCGLTVRQWVEENVSA